MLNKIIKNNEDWQAILTAKQYEITRKKGTESLFSGEYHDFKKKGETINVSAAGWSYSALRQNLIQEPDGLVFGNLFHQIILERLRTTVFL